MEVSAGFVSPPWVCGLPSSPASSLAVPLSVCVLTSSSCEDARQTGEGSPACPRCASVSNLSSCGSAREHGTSGDTVQPRKPLQKQGSSRCLTELQRPSPMADTCGRVLTHEGERLFTTVQHIRFKTTVGL